MTSHLVHGLLREAAARRPEHTALEDGERRLTYRELDQRSDRVAQLLAATGVARGDRVGLYLDKSIESVVGAYGAMKAGCAYVPLDPAAPPARLGFILGDCAVECLLTGREKAARWLELVDSGARLRTIVTLNAAAADIDAATLPQGVDLFGADHVDSHIAVPLDRHEIDRDLAYILYTSGSTGAPKGVMLSHQNCLAFVLWAVNTFGIDSDDRLTSHAPLHFDLSTLDLYAAAAAAATVVLVPQAATVFPVEAKRLIEDRAITVWYSVPSALTMLTLRGKLAAGSLPSLRTIFFAGEVFPTKYLRQLMSQLPHVRFVNLYGPTETNVCTWYDVPTLPDDMIEDIPIGRAIENVETVILTDDGRAAAPGEVGELHVRGNTVMQGYWGDPDRTARSLVPDGRGIGVGDLAYRTGDLVQELPGGDLRFLGRRDAQIKSRGYRIELGEIETALHAHPQVVECGVVPVPDDVVTNRIRAHVVVAAEVTEGELARWCADRIPKYMIPEQWVFSEELPKTSTGKLDRQGLLAGGGRKAD